MPKKCAYGVLARIVGVCLFLMSINVECADVRKLSKTHVHTPQQPTLITSFSGERITTSVDLFNEHDQLIVQFRKKQFAPEQVRDLTPIFEKIVRDTSTHDGGVSKKDEAYKSDSHLRLGFKTKLGAQRTEFHPWDVIPTDVLKRVVMPFLNSVSELFACSAPMWYQQHVDILKMNNDALRIGQSVFSTFSLNLGTPGRETDAQTFFHKDTGHAENGCEVLVILGDALSGGDLVFPEYNVALKLEAGDLAIMRGYDVLHGNTPLTQGKKLTVLLHILGGHDRKCEEAKIKKVIEKMVNLRSS